MSDIIQVPNMFKNYVYPQKRTIPINTNIINTYHSEITISREQALEDFETFKYLINNAYSGRDYWEMRGVKFKECFAMVESLIRNQEYMPSKLLCEAFYQAFSGKIVDNHLWLRVFNDDEVYCFSAQKLAYFSGITVENREGRYIVVQSDCHGVQNGDIIECADVSLFPTLAPQGKKWFYVGIRDWTPVQTISIAVNGHETVVSLHKSRARDYSPEKSVFFKLNYCSEVPTVQSGTFYDPFHHVPRDCGAELGDKLKKEKHVVWVLAGNGGGSSDYALHFIEALNNYANNYTHVAHLQTHITDFSKVDLNNNYTEWRFSLDEPVDKTKSQFKGTLYTIMNSTTGSSAENAVGYAKSVKNNILIGENSAGVGLFGEVQSYILRHSMIRLGIPCKIFLNGVNEGEGYLPDYWVDSPDLIGAVTQWIRNQ